MGLHCVALDITEGKIALARASGAEVTQQIVKQIGGGAHGVLVTAVPRTA
jgi:propanol-preferring alcohol dehydrogenase